MEIISPPFPADTTTVPRLLQHLEDLREWIGYMRLWANEMAAAVGIGADVVPEDAQLPHVPDADGYRLVSIVDIMRSYLGLRKLRESWDEMVRIYEEHWEIKPAVMWRLGCVRLAVDILQQAFVSPEVREARAESLQRKAKKAAQQMLKRMGIPKEYRDNIVFGSLGIMLNVGGIPGSEEEHGEQEDDEEGDLNMFPEDWDTQINDEDQDETGPEDAGSSG